MQRNAASGLFTQPSTISWNHRLCGIREADAAEKTEMLFPLLNIETARPAVKGKGILLPY
jgi:hypothetical protein